MKESNLKSVMKRSLYTAEINRPKIIMRKEQCKRAFALFNF